MREKKPNTHLPLYGIGPALCFPMAILSAIGIYLSHKGYIPGVIENKVISIVMLILGILLIIEGIVLFFCADLNGNLQKNIKENKLKTNGSYKFVRNPCYCLFLLGSTGALLNVEPDSFNSYFDALYWATVSLTTVGYGDIYPISVAGRLVTMFSSFMGIAIVALPAGIITSGFMEELNKKTEK